MKMTLNTIAIFLIMTLAFGSCSKEEDSKKYSCSPEIDNWVKSKYHQLNDLTIEEVSTESLEKQKAIFNAVSPEKRLYFWKAKLDNLLLLKWDLEERHHIELLKDYLCVEHFSDPDEIKIIVSQNRLEEFIKTWVFYGENKFDWTQGMIFSMVHRLDTPQQDGRLIINNPNSDEPPGGSSSNNCKCSTDDDWCNFLGGPEGKCTLHYLNCDEVSWGCGALFVKKCDGKCKLVDGS